MSFGTHFRPNFYSIIPVFDGFAAPINRIETIDLEPTCPRLKHRLSECNPTKKTHAPDPADPPEWSHRPPDKPRLTAHAFRMTLVVQGNKLPQNSYPILSYLMLSYSISCISCYLKAPCFRPKPLQKHQQPEHEIKKRGPRKLQF